MRTIRLTLEKMYKIQIGPGHILMSWNPRHAYWTINRCQTKATGRTAYKSLRKKDYNTPMVPYGECVLYKVVTDDKFEERWSE